MDNNGRATKPLEFRAAGGAVQMMTAVVNVKCNCGFPHEVPVVFSSVVPMRTPCPKCGTIFFIAVMGFDQRDPTKTKIGLGWETPTITRPNALVT